MAKVKSTKIHETFGDKVLDIITGAILVLVILVVGYPCIYVISCSFSSSSALEIGSVVLWPVDFTLEAYEFILYYKQVWVGLRNTIFYCCLSVLFGTGTTILVAYPLSKDYLQGKKFYNSFFFLSTRLAAGLIPVFILKTSLGMYNNISAIIFDGLFGFQSVIVISFIMGIPGDLFDAARIDGAGEFQMLFKIAIPLAKATLSVLVLYSIVAQWNEYFTSMIYLRDNNLYPLQLVLRPIMVAASSMGSMDTSNMATVYQQQANQGLENVRYALILVSTIPMVGLYMIIQKSFKGGVMMGSIKG